MAKRRAKSQTASLTPDQKKSGIDPIYLAVNDVPHTVSSRQELQLCFRPHFDSRSARKVMGLQSPRSPSCRDFRTPPQESHGSPGREKPFGCGPCGEVQSIL
jgi:hypothetical protein